MIRLENVTKRFGRYIAVDRVSLELEPGGITAFLGPNGAGKTTTMRIMCGFLYPDAGSVTVLDRSFASHAREIKRELGYLPEHNPLYPDMTVVEFLRLAGRLRGLRGEALVRAVGAMVERCGLADRLKQTIGTLSKGYRQRVGLAQALIHDPRVLILDEPTTGLDPNQTSEIHDLIKDLGVQKTVLISTHILQHVPELCTRVLVMNRGQLVFSGEPRDFLAHGHSPSSAILVTDQSEPSVRELAARFSFIDGIRLLETGDPFSRYELHGALDQTNMAEVFTAIKAESWRVSDWSASAPSPEQAFAALTERHT